MHRIIIIIFLSAIIVPALNIYAQEVIGEMPYRHYTSKDGLAGSNVLAFLQDKNGFIWLATSNGLSRFDGQEFKNYRTEDGLTSNNLTGLGSVGDSIFISSYDKGISYLYKGNIHSYKILNEKTPLIHHMINDENHLYAYGNYLYDISEHNLKKVISISNTSQPGNRRVFQINDAELINDGYLFFCSSYGLYKYYNSTLSKFKMKGNIDPFFFTCIYKTNDNEILLGSLGKIWKLDGTGISKIYKNINLPGDKAVQHLLVDNFNNLWLSLINNGLYLIRNSTLINIGDRIGLDKAQINFIKKDNEGNIWIGTFGKGIFCFYNLAVTNYTALDGLKNNYILSIASDNLNRILIGTFNGLNIYKGGRFNNISTGFAGSYHYIRNIQKCNNGDICVTGGFDMSENNDGKVVTKIYNKRRVKIFNSAIAFEIGGDSILIGGWENDLSYTTIIDNKLRIKSRIKLFEDSKQDYKINKILKDKEGNLWIGTSGGLCLIKKGRQIYFNKNSVLSNAINDIEESPAGDIWIAGAEGVSVLSNGNWKNYLKEGDFDLSSSTSVTFDNLHNTWIGNSKGLYKISSNKISRFTDDFGLISNEVNSVYFSNESNSLWVGTNEGLSKIDLTLLKNYKKIICPVVINEVETNDSVYNNFANLNFSSDIKKVSVRFKAINFREPASLIYQYKIGVKEDERWSYTESPEIQFASLSPGKYKLLLRAKTVNGEWSNPAQVSFLIETPFVQSYLFYAMILLSLTICAVLLTRKFIGLKQKKIQEKKEIESKIVGLKQHALAAMVNPHFIFNSLNSIQNFMNNHNMKEANIFLTKFAKLIRLNLNMAQESFITLQEEIDRLELYLALEKMRFDNNFAYSIKIDDNIVRSQLQIPNMIIQPFVENAIWHGILPKGKKGNLEITCNFDNDSDLIISIKDNGVGFNKNIDTKRSGYISRGINIIKDRLELLNSSSNSKELIKIISNENASESGTTVKITLPKNLYMLKA